MRFHQLRNATCVLEFAQTRILVDPMLGPKGSAGPLAFIRHRPRRNPTVELPSNFQPALGDLDAAVITHCRYGHVDHLDKAGAALLANRGLPVYCQTRDATFLQKKGLRTEPLSPHQPRDFFGGKITAFHAVHGYGLVAKLMGPGAGYLIEVPGEPSIYFSGDTVLTEEVKRVLTEHKPDVAVMHAGSASLDVGKPILMPMNELIEFLRLAPGRVVATHMEAMNHCPTTRDDLRAEARRAALAEKLVTPADGESVELRT